MNILEPEKLNETYSTGETITIACRASLKETPEGNAVWNCTSEGWAQSECEGKNM